MVRKNTFFCLLLGLAMFQAVNAFGKSFPPLYVFEEQDTVDQIDPYDAEWRKVDSLMDQGAWQLANRTLEDLYFRLKRDQADLQLVTCLVYRINLLPHIEAQPDSIGIVMLTEELVEIREPMRQVLQSLLADLYLTYLHHHSEKIDALPASRAKPEDFTTWNRAGFRREIADLYDASLQPAAYLQQLPVSTFRSILVPEDYAAHLRPSVYDLLAHRALTYYMGKGQAEGESFPPTALSLMGNPTAFLQMNLALPDLPADGRRSLEIFQQLLAFHFLREEIAPFVDVELMRLRYLRARLPLEETEDRYLAVLKELVDAYVTHPASTEIQYEIAQFHRKRGLQYQPRVQEAYRWELRQARENCRKAIARYPHAIGAEQCQRLLSLIERPHLEMEVEEVQLPGAPYRILLDYANLDTVWFQVYALPDSARTGLLATSALRERFAGKKPLQQWPVALPNESDYQRHSVEIPMPELSRGAYLLIASQAIKPTSIPPLSVAVRTQVSRISMYFRQEEGFFQVVDRLTGKPLQGIRAAVADWSPQDSAYGTAQVYSTDASGAFSLGLMDSLRYVRIDLRSESDRYISGPLLIDPGQSARQREETLSLRFFTDRTDYQPGGRIWFKALLLEAAGGEMHAAADRELLLYLENDAGISVDTVQVRTNKWGTDTGSFHIPLTGWSPKMTLRGTDGTAIVQVGTEVQAAPSLSIRVDSFDNTSLTGEPIHLTGTVQNAQDRTPEAVRLTYRILRKMVGKDKNWLATGTGEIPVDENGAFNWDFVLPSDQAAGRESAVQTFRLEIMATDSREAYGTWDTPLYTANRTLRLDADIDEIVYPGQFSAVLLSTLRPNGAFVPTRGRLRIYPLEVPDQIFRRRQWAEPDLHLIDKPGYHELFPHDVYADEADRKKWKRGKPVLARVFDTSQSLEIDLSPMDTVAQGMYLLELFTLDGRGKEVLTEKHFTLYQPRQKEAVIPAWLEIYPRRQQAIPGETVNLTLGSTEKNVSVLMTTLRGNGSVETRYLKVGPRRKRISLSVPPAYAGTLEVVFSGVRNNAYYQEKVFIEVSRPDRNLDIDFVKFNQVLQPGARGNWELVARGPQGIETQGEWTIAWIEDAALHAFPVPDVPGADLQVKWQHSEGFGRLSAEPLAYQWDNGSPPTNSLPYARINWYGDRINHRGRMPESHTFAEEGIAGELPIRQWRYVAPLRAGEGKTAEKYGFFPQLIPNAEGKVQIEMPMPREEGNWRLMAWVHTADGRFAYAERPVQVRKELAASIFTPAFAREGDEVVVSARIKNLKTRPIAGVARLEIQDGLTGQVLTSRLLTEEERKPFRLAQGGTHLVEWRIRVAEAVPVLHIALHAEAGGLVDVAERWVPVFADRACVATHIPLIIPGKSNRRFPVEAVLADETTSSFGSCQFSLEFSAHPAWYGIAALSEMMQPEAGDTRQWFYRYSAEWMARQTIGRSPRLAQWLADCPPVPIYTPPHLPETLTQPDMVEMIRMEAPWELARLTGPKEKPLLCQQWTRQGDSRDAILGELVNRQMGSGGFFPFPGLPASRTLTHEILTQMGRMQQHFPLVSAPEIEVATLITSAIAFMDQQIKQDYERLTRNGFNTQADQLEDAQIRYLYMRSFFRDIPRSYGSQVAYEYYFNQARSYWRQKSPEQQAMIALILARNDEGEVANRIVQSLRQQALHDAATGMYWIMGPRTATQTNSISFHTLMMEAFWEISPVEQEIQEMTIWLLQQRHGAGWPGVDGTCAAASVLLMTGKSWLETAAPREGALSQLAVHASPIPENAEETDLGSYQQSVWNPQTDMTDIADLEVRQGGESTVWGSLNIQRLQSLSQPEATRLPVRIERSFFLIPEGTGTPRRMDRPMRLRRGDKVQVQIRLRVSRDLQNIQLKAAESAAFYIDKEQFAEEESADPGYFTHAGPSAIYYIFEELSAGLHQLEYTLLAAHEGVFNQGFLSLSSLLNPEWQSLLPGATFQVEE